MTIDKGTDGKWPSVPYVRALLLLLWWEFKIQTVGALVTICDLNENRLAWLEILLECLCMEICNSGPSNLPYFELIMSCYERRSSSPIRSKVWTINCCEERI